MAIKHLPPPTADDFKEPKKMEKYLNHWFQETGRRLGLNWTEFNFTSSSLADIVTKSTDLLPEGTTNLYHTSERVDDRVASLLVAGNAITLTYNDSAGTLTIIVSKAAASTDATTTVAGAAGATYTATEQGMINALAVDVVAIKNSLNDLKAKMRTANLLTT